MFTKFSRSNIFKSFIFALVSLLVFNSAGMCQSGSAPSDLLSPSLRIAQEEFKVFYKIAVVCRELAQAHENGVKTNALKKLRDYLGDRYVYTGVLNDTAVKVYFPDENIWLTSFDPGSADKQPFVSINENEQLEEQIFQVSDELAISIVLGKDLSREEPRSQILDEKLYREDLVSAGNGVFVGDQHHALYSELKDKYPNGVILLNYDAHSDLGMTVLNDRKEIPEQHRSKYDDLKKGEEVPVEDYNWISHAMKNGFVKVYYWFFGALGLPSCSYMKNLKYSNEGESLGNNLNAKMPDLSEVKDPVVLTIDMDYFISKDIFGDLGVSGRISKDDIPRHVRRMSRRMCELFIEKGVRPDKVYLIRSPYHSITGGRLDQVERILKETFVEFMGKLHSEIEEEIISSDQTSAVSQMSHVNEIDRMLNENPAKSKDAVYYIVTKSAMMKDQWDWITEINKITTASNEHLIIVDDTDRMPVDEDAVLKEREKRIKGKIKDIIDDAKNTEKISFNIAVNDDNLVKMSWPDEVYAVKFQGETQLEVILVSLRAFQRGGQIGLNTLLELYEVLEGEKYSGEIPAVNERDAFEKFARSFILSLPKAEEIPIDTMKETQEILLSLLKMA